MPHHDEEPEEYGCHSCNGVYSEDQMASRTLCLECQEDQDNEYENSFRNAFR